MSIKATVVPIRGGAPPRGVTSGLLTPVSAPPLQAPSVEPTFPALYAEHVHFVWRSLRLLGVAAEHLEDAVQDTFTVVARQLSSFEGRSSMTTWIFAITQRVAANHHRTRRRKLERLRPLVDNVVCTEPTPQATAEAAEAAASIERFCEQLSDERRRLFILALLEAIPPAELAASEGVPINTLYSRIRSLRQELKRFLDLGGRAPAPSDPAEPREVEDD